MLRCWYKIDPLLKQREAFLLAMDTLRYEIPGENVELGPFSEALFERRGLFFQGPDGDVREVIELFEKDLEDRDIIFTKKMENV